MVKVGLAGNRDRAFEETLRSRSQERVLSPVLLFASVEKDPNRWL